MQDFKCTIRTYDNSTTDGEEIELTIFRKESEMPEIGCGDVVAMTHVKACSGPSPFTLQC